MELKLLKTFQTVAQELSFTRAAEQLDYAQSSITSQIQALENDLGVPLFERLGKRVALTAAGEQLLAYAGQMLSLAQEAHDRIKSREEPAGRLNISSPETLSAYRLPPLLREYHRRYPRVQLVLKSFPSEQLLQNLLDGVVDMAVALGEPIVNPDVFVVEPLCQEPLYLMACPDHPLSTSPCITNHDLRRETFLLTETNCTYRLLFERTLLADGVRLPDPMEFNSVEAIKQCVMAGIGVAFLPEIAARRELISEQMVKLNWQQSLLIDTQLVWHRDKWMSPALLAFIALCKEMLGT
ncbi:MAG: LysR family transcriptional regulator [Anaerolineae bacterium]